MTSDQIITLLVAIVAAAGTSIVTGLFGMPQVRATAKKDAATGDVTVSGDAREWAKTFAERADRAEARAEAAEARADRAEQRAETAENHAEALDLRCDELESKQIKLARYTRLLQKQMAEHGWTVPEPPSDLSPPL